MPGITRTGTAGWSIPKQHAAAFPEDGSHLERYARRFPAVEINSSFYRPHRPATYARWAAAVPADFRFSVKVPRDITHLRRLADAAEPLAQFLSGVQALGERLGPLLVQLPPGLRHNPARADDFWTALRTQFDGDVVCEPRHASWFTDAVDAQLTAFRIARVAADPAPAAGAGRPGGWPGIAYYRLHGSPQIYNSAYPADIIDDTARQMRGSDASATWCIFDNTALGEATRDALRLLERL
ncbi:MAG: hypothetical protein JWP20_2525 [Roseomonas sp.]|nr:hypothetical protein [Roseomonas sp.]